jgi:hypothetical protein
MAQTGRVFSTGPVACFVKPQDAWKFLGYGVRAPQFFDDPAYVGVFCDLAGSQKQMDDIFDGADGSVTVELVYFNRDVLAEIQDYAGDRTGALVPGSSQPGELGTLMVSEGCAYELCFTFPRSVKAIFQDPATGRLPACRHYFAAFLDRSSQEQGLGTPLKPTLTWNCRRAFDSDTENEFGVGEFTLYDEILPSGLPTPV